MQLLHPGSFYRNRDPRPVLHAIAELKKRDVRVELTQLGPCEASFDLVNLAEHLGIAEMVRIEPAVPHREMLMRMKQADAFLLLQPGTSMQVPGKLFEMMMFRKPIAAIASEGEVTEIIRQFKMGTVASPENVPAIADAIEELTKFPLDESLWENALKTYDGRELTRCLAEVLDSVTGA